MNVYTIVQAVLLISATAYGNEVQQDEWSNLGTVLFTSHDLKKPTMEKSRIALLQARKYFQYLVPHPEMLSASGGYVQNTLSYFRDAYLCIKKESPDSDVDRIMTKALSDVVGGYMKHYMVPFTKILFYGGVASFYDADRVFSFFNEVKEYLDTNGTGWRDPDPAVLKTFAIASPRVPRANRCSLDPCNNFAYLEKTKDGFEIPMPSINWDEETMFLPFKNESTFTLKSPKHAHTLNNYYHDAACCVQSMSPEAEKKFNDKYQMWIITSVIPNLYEKNNNEYLYVALGDVMDLKHSSKTMIDGNYSVLDYSDKTIQEENTQLDTLSAFKTKSIFLKSQTILGIVLLVEFIWCLCVFKHIIFKTNKNCFQFGKKSSQSCLKCTSHSNNLTGIIIEQECRSVGTSGTFLCPCDKENQLSHAKCDISVSCNQPTAIQCADKNTSMVDSSHTLFMKHIGDKLSKNCKGFKIRLDVNTKANVNINKPSKISKKVTIASSHKEIVSDCRPVQPCIENVCDYYTLPQRSKQSVIDYSTSSQSCIQNITDYCTTPQPCKQVSDYSITPHLYVQPITQCSTFPQLSSPLKPEKIPKDTFIDTNYALSKRDWGENKKCYMEFNSQRIITGSLKSDPNAESSKCNTIISTPALVATGDYKKTEVECPCLVCLQQQTSTGCMCSIAMTQTAVNKKTSKASEIKVDSENKETVMSLEKLKKSKSFIKHPTRRQGRYLEIQIEKPKTADIKVGISGHGHGTRKKDERRARKSRIPKIAGKTDISPAATRPGGLEHIIETVQDEADPKVFDKGIIVTTDPNQHLANVEGSRAIESKRQSIYFYQKKVTAEADDKSLESTRKHGKLKCEKKQPKIKECVEIIEQVAESSVVVMQADEVGTGFRKNNEKMEERDGKPRRSPGQKRQSLIPKLKKQSAADDATINNNKDTKDKDSRLNVTL